MVCILEKLNSTGWVELDPFVDSGSLIGQAHSELSKAFNINNFYKTVDSDGIVMKTLNGDALLRFSPSVRRIYEYTLNSLRLEVPDLHEVSSKAIGISANYLSGENDKFRMHFDRHQLTVVVYLTDAPSMPLIIYPNVRRDPILAGAKDSFDISQMSPHVVKPLANKALIFLGRRTLHGIENRTSVSAMRGREVHRFSLQFAFDFDPFDYGSQSYYGAAEPIGEVS